MVPVLSMLCFEAIHILFHGRVNKLLTYYCLNDLALATINVNSLRDKKKRDLVFNWLVAKKIDLICLQEQFFQCFALKDKTILGEGQHSRIIEKKYYPFLQIYKA
jgi:hypothetical protein